MRVFPENFDCLVLHELHFGAPQITGDTLAIPVMNLPIFNPHPLFGDQAIRQHPALGGVVDGLLVFRGVLLSKRKMSDYIGDPMSSTCKFGEYYVIIDINSDESYYEMNLYSFEGRLDAPPAVIAYWDIIARSFELQVE